MSLSDYLSSPFLFAGIQNNGIQNSPNFSNEDRRHMLEVEFCKNFKCCGLQLDNLHKLLEHYEEHHLSLPVHNNGVDGEPGHFLLKQQSPKEQLTHTDLSTLENPHNPLQIQTMETITKGLDTPSLSPSGSRSGSLQPNKKPFLSTANCDEDDLTEKPYRCDVEDCDKAYKNVNGLKYHRLHGHCPPNEEEPDADRPFVCSIGTCRRRYKNLNGLKYHTEHTHSIKLTLTSDMFIKTNSNEPHGLKRKLPSPTSLASESS